MAKRRNQSRNQPRRPKQEEEVLIDVVEAKETYQSWFEENKLKVLGIIGILAIVVGGFIIYKYAIMAPKQKAANEAIYRAEMQFSKDSFALALENPGGGFEGFLDIIGNYNGTKAANLAKYYAGISYLNLGRFEDAIEYLESYRPADDITPIMKFGAMGDAYSELGNFGEAVSMYSKAANAEDNDFLTPYYLKKLGMLQAREGNTSDALSAYQKIKDKYASSSQGSDIDRFIAQLQ